MKMESKTSLSSSLSSAEDEELTSSTSTEGESNSGGSKPQSLPYTSFPSPTSIPSDSVAALESSIRMFIESQDGSLTDDDLGETSNYKEKVNRGTLTEDTKPPKCKYCFQRLSKLRKVEKMQSLKDHHASRRPRHLSPKQACKNRACQTPASFFERAEMSSREFRSLSMVLGFRDGKPKRTETYCKCVLHGKERDCRCGEEDKYFEWVWDAKTRGHATNLQERGRLVVFHKDYSCGTTAIRGSQAMDKDQHFWEIKMTTPVYGTDMMVGVGTENVELDKYHNQFCSMLGHDMDSWGMSYDGRVQHGGRKREYCSRFGQGAIIGVHLDMWHGTLAFFKNRQALGVAFRGLRGRTLYPLACSTAARSGMKVISSRSFPSSLQFLCCQRLRQFVPAHLSVLDTLAMPPGLRAFLANNMTWLLHVPQMSPPKSKAGHICSICMPLKGVLEGCTDDEEESGDEIDHIHDDLRFSDDETDEEEIEETSPRTPPHRNIFGRLLTTSSPVSPSSSDLTIEDTGPRSIPFTSRLGLKRLKLEIDEAGPSSFSLDEDDEEDSRDDEDKNSGETTEEDSSGTKSADVDTEESMEADRTKPLAQLGKRKRV